MNSFEKSFRMLINGSQRKVDKQQERIEELEQENRQLESELEEYRYQDYIKEADADLLAHMRREMVYYV